MKWYQQKLLLRVYGSMPKLIVYSTRVEVCRGLQIRNPETFMSPTQEHIHVHIALPFLEKAGISKI